ncbi:hypothetical protein ACERII_13305 [Evansella sp. AB-rgal1]|uniref:hypothetical protein n=1 Tax=Evansella sp. AB-rgal1 TaxID=3242696 RepID=UPI00359DB9AD
MTETDIAMVIYISFLFLSFFLSLKYGTVMIRKTGLVLAQSIVAASINLVLGIIAIVGWFFYAWGVNEFLFFGGIVIGVIIIVTSLVVLSLTIFLRRKVLIKYNENLN